VAAAKAGADEEICRATQEATYVVDGDDDPQEAWVRVVEGVEEVGIGD
jgi:hypothetical protein